MFMKVAIAPVLLLPSCIALSQSREGDALEQADANQDGKVTRQEYVDARATQFARMDRNGDGVVDDADSRERANQSAVGKRMAAAMRGRIDTNSDGKISKDEFVNAPTMLFDRFDADKNGELDAKELEAARGAAERLRERRKQE
jgi:Ca2+-binding EF-hand superfamily protein